MTQWCSSRTRFILYCGLVNVLQKNVPVRAFGTSYHYLECFLVGLQIQTVAVGAAIGQACLLLSAGTKGKRYMMPHATGSVLWVDVWFMLMICSGFSRLWVLSAAMIQQPRLPSTGQISAIDVHIRAKEVWLEKVLLKWGVIFLWRSVERTRLWDIPVYYAGREQPGHTS